MSDQWFQAKVSPCCPFLAEGRFPQLSLNNCKRSQVPEITLKWFLQLLLLGGRSSARSRTPTPLFMQLTDLCKHCTSGHHQDLAQRPSLLPQPPAGCTQGLPQPLVWLVTVAGPALLLWHGGTAPSATTLLCFLLSCPLLMLFNTVNPRAGMGSRTRAACSAAAPAGSRKK